METATDDPPPSAAAMTPSRRPRQPPTSCRGDRSPTPTPVQRSPPIRSRAFTAPRSRSSRDRHEGAAPGSPQDPAPGPAPMWDEASQVVKFDSGLVQQAADHGAGEVHALRPQSRPQHHHGRQPRQLPAPSADRPMPTISNAAAPPARSADFTRAGEARAEPEHRPLPWPAPRRRPRNVPVPIRHMVMAKAVLAHFRQGARSARTITQARIEDVFEWCAWPAASRASRCCANPSYYSVHQHETRRCSSMAPCLGRESDFAERNQAALHHAVHAPGRHGGR